MPTLPESSPTFDWSAFVGLPWRDRGRGPDGFDCWGLLIAAFKAGTGIQLPTYSADYSNSADERETRAVLAGERGDWSKIDERASRPFDAALMTIGKRVHVGLLVRRGLMLHMPVNKTSVIVPLSRYSAVLDGIYRHTGML